MTNGPGVAFAARCGDPVHSQPRGESTVSDPLLMVDPAEPAGELVDRLGGLGAGFHPSFFGHGAHPSKITNCC
jgi:hypothetical protein